MSVVYVNDAPPRILVRRDGAFGDVCSITPVTRRLRRENPDAIIIVQTHYGGIFSGNPDVNFAGPAVGGNYDRIVDLNMSFEKRLRKVHAIDCYMEDAFGDRGTPEERSTVIAKVPVPDLPVDWKRAIAIHPTVSWRNRTMPLAFWNRLVAYLTGVGYQCVTVGTAQDYDLTENVVSTRGLLTPQQQTAVIAASRAFVSSESGVYAGLLPATDTPGVVMFTMSTFELSAPYRHGEQGWRFKVIWPKVPCHGCSARIAVPVTHDFGCERGDFACIDTFDPIEVADAVVGMAEKYQ